MPGTPNHKLTDSGEGFGVTWGVRVSDCMTCRHRHRGRVTCDAFPTEPAGVPIPIASGAVSHRVPYAGDGGVQYDRDPEAVLPSWVLPE